MTALTMKPKPTRRTMIVENWLDTLNDDDRSEALDYLTDVKQFAHTELAKMVGASLGHRVSDRAIIGWRERNL